MAELHSWHPIDENADDKEVIITVDFTVTGRPEAGFAELATHLETPYGVWESLPPAVGDETGMNGDDYLDRWTTELRESGVEVKAVFGYCASSVFALAIADRVGTWQAKPQVVLFDPTAATGFTVLYYGFFRVVDALAAVLTDDEVRDAHAAGETAQQTHDDLETLTKEFVRIYREVGGTAFERVGLEADRAEELVSWFSSYMTYLVAASQLTVPADLSGVDVIRSAELPGALEIGAREVRFDIDHSGLLSQPEVAQAVSGLLA
ncbi:hypothetical protein H4696_009308 [Amycolatopsis lexingtonensis]|uniref:Uncharacterized protein n=1 Tax=Amycolatopsis lexingtonensis TaxID=218822 RepID=A0ABR9IG95_9PSEU|nr:hypothetical protein [Amycolatopsis lexingtonensis]MBE1502208.1 hypothetical protein [Amycolatopsis lexingtonensis]